MLQRKGKGIGSTCRIAAILALVTITGMLLPVATTSSNNNGQAPTIPASWQVTNSIRSPAPVKAAVLWYYATGGWIEGSPIVADFFGDGEKEVLVASWDDYLYCLNGTTGAEVWSLTPYNCFDPRITADLFGTGRSQIITSSGTDVYCLNGTTGTKIWNSTLNIHPGSIAVADLFGNGKKEVLVSSGDDYVYCLNGTSGASIWNSSTGGFAGHASAIDLLGDGKEEVITSRGCDVYCLNATTGNELWKFTPPIDGYYASYHVLSSNGKKQIVATVYSDMFSNLPSNIYCLNGSTGTIIWNSTVDLYWWGSILVADLFKDGGEEVVACSMYGKAYCFNGTNGNEIWNSTIGAEVRSAPVAADLFAQSGGLQVLIGPEDHQLRCLNGTTGAMIWKSDWWAPEWGPIVADLYEDGKLEVVAGYGDELTCLNGTTGKPLWFYTTGGRVEWPPAVADLFGDGKLQLVAGSYDGIVYCLNWTGSIPPGVGGKGKEIPAFAANQVVGVVAISATVITAACAVMILKTSPRRESLRTRRRRSPRMPTQNQKG